MLATLWEASDRLCGKRLKVILPELLKSMESHGHMNLDVSLRALVLSDSAATIDRLLRSIREQGTGKKHSRPKKKTRAAIAVKTFSEWDDVAPGSLEVDFVAHCGGHHARDEQVRAARVSGMNFAFGGFQVSRALNQLLGPSLSLGTDLCGETQDHLLS